MITQIAAASEQQSSASEQINKNVEAISTVTNQTASSTQQVAHTAEDLNRLTENLQQHVDRFKLQQNTGHESTGGTGMHSSAGHQRSSLAVRSNGVLVHHDA
jgi:ABC-type transporter Mla subunit MlaD